MNTLTRFVPSCALAAILLALKFQNVYYHSYYNSKSNVTSTNVIIRIERMADSKTLHAIRPAIHTYPLLPAYHTTKAPKQQI